jgi:hypothetical protein
MTGPGARHGLYDPAYEHDGCGIGFVAHVGGTRSHDVVRQGLTLLDNLSHRSAVGCDPCTGDGSGILLQIPHAFLARECADGGPPLPEPGAYGVGMLFLPRAPAARHACEALVEHAIAEEGCVALGWRDVPTDEASLGDVARRTMPAVRQVFVAPGPAARLPADAETVTSHGDFHRGELIRRGGELAVLDVDEACRAAPARDLATYVAHAAAREDVDPSRLLDALLGGYGRRPEAVEWYLSAMLLRRAERPFHRLEEDWPARVEELVEAADRALGR